MFINWRKVNYIWVVCRLPAFSLYRSISPPSQRPFKAFKHIYMCTGAGQNNRGVGLEKNSKALGRVAKGQKRYRTRVVQTKEHFFSFLEVNIRLRIKQDNIWFFLRLMQLYSALLPFSAPYNFLVFSHSRCLYKVDRANIVFALPCPFPWHVDVDRNR